MTGHLHNRVIELIVLHPGSYAQRGCRSKNDTKKNVIYGFRVDCVWNVMAHAHKPDFFFRRNRRVHLNRRGLQFSRLLAAEVSKSAVVMLDTPCSELVLRIMATHSISWFSFHFPSRASPSAITFQLDSTINVITNFLRVANNIWEQLGEKFLSLGPFLDRHYLTVNPAFQTAGTFNVQLHSSEGLNTFTVKCFRRRVWETRRSGVTGWELPSHVSDIWCLSSLQLTRNSNWQRESLFRCRMWPHWMYVPKSIIRKQNKSRLTWVHLILRVAEITSP
jgi:hypothetical protein